MQLNNPSAALPCQPQTVKEEISVLAELPLYIREDEAPELYKMSAEDGVEVGPFTVRLLHSNHSLKAILLQPCGDARLLLTPLLTPM